ncbi:alpha/beta hydrolase [Actinoplanes sichuanensis]|uniref:Alpha/beta fold hydrolase n=1 Tax=Actinoplanes sichuanensis TaxID=512349 RepID=A0ABW4A7H4_9ACTN|nr:alpha/beta fold hydrolase [Actinoplanes sichuanensis]BEL03513.1 alpha/beta hydrolase [Actinoplanes sichuanensis]
MSQDRVSRHQIETRDDRVLTFEVTGHPDGSPVFLLHGSPGSRIGPRPRGSVLYRLGIQLISYDRPGYGGSTRHPKRSVADAAEDIGAIADGLGLERFAVVGRSGGGPHALAAAARLPERVSRTAVLVGIAPSDAEGLDWLNGMTDGNVREYETADNDWPKHVERLRLLADRARRDPEFMVDNLRRQMTAADRQVVDDIAIRRLLTETYVEAFAQGPFGWIDDVAAFRSAWEFQLSEVTGEVLIWHGADDNFSPVSHARWLAEQIPQAEVRIQASTAHFGAVEVLPEVLHWLVAGRPLVAARH